MKSKIKIIQQRIFSTMKSRREMFEFSSSKIENDKSVTIRTETGPVEVPLEMHPLGGFGQPSLIPFNEKLLEELVCPLTGGALEFDRERNVLVSREGGVAFPINAAGWPLFLKKWAIPLDKLT